MSLLGVGRLRPHLEPVSGGRLLGLFRSACRGVGPGQEAEDARVAGVELGSDTEFLDRLIG